MRTGGNPAPIPGGFDRSAEIPTETSRTHDGVASLLVYCAVRFGPAMRSDDPRRWAIHGCTATTGPLHAGIPTVVRIRCAAQDAIISPTDCAVGAPVLRRASMVPR